MATGFDAGRGSARQKRSAASQDRFAFAGGFRAGACFKAGAVVTTPETGCAAAAGSAFTEGLGVGAGASLAATRVPGLAATGCATRVVPQPDTDRDAARSRSASGREDRRTA